VLGGPYHTAIRALAEGTPVIVLPGNTFKNEGLGTMLGFDILFNSGDDFAGIMAEADRLVHGGEPLRGQIRGAVEHARDARPVRRRG
jgi:hypothetical protein